MKRTIALISIAIFGCAAALILLVHSDSRKAQAPAKPTQSTNPCPDNKPCIQLTAEDGTVYKLNDFRFAPDHCIYILSLPDNTSRKLCGNWHLDWIGPDTTKSIKTIST